MSFQVTTAVLGTVLVVAPYVLSQDVSQAAQEPSRHSALSVEPGGGPLSKALSRIQLELKQIVEDINALDARIQRRFGGSITAPGASRASRIHQLLNSGDPAGHIQEFLNSQESQRLDSCLRSGRLYRNLAAETFNASAWRTAEDGKTTGQQILLSGFDESAQLVFLSRMIPELELRYGELEAQTKTGPDTKHSDLRQRLAEALRHDDELWFSKLMEVLASAGQTPQQFAARMLSQARGVSPSAASEVAEGLSILSAGVEVWKLAEVPEINPDFLIALDCQWQSLNDSRKSGSQTPGLKLTSCLTSVDGSPVQAFVASQSKPLQASQTNPKTPAAELEERRGRDIFRLPTEKELRELQTEGANRDSAPTATGQPPAFGVSNTPVKRPKIPSWWIRCACPSDHPDAGIVFEGVRWHAPVLQCPNPELRRLEVK